MFLKKVILTVELKVKEQVESKYKIIMTLIAFYATY